MLKKSILAVTAIAFFASCSSAPSESVETTEAAEEREVVAESSVMADVSSSAINWKGFKTYSKGDHVGTINIKEGEFKTEGDMLVGGSFIIDMNTIHCTDLADDEESYGKLVGHLKSDDFFAVEEHPESRFVITDITEEANDEKNTTHIIKGNLTMRDITKNISFPAKVKVENGSVTIKSPEFAIDRTKWNVMFRSSGIEGVAKDNLIDDKILLELNVRG
ncbi:MAG: YceI family protein [Cryomorphaceae bacterium]|nr:YceI family protein [Cryomorphaceae bacterium]